MAERPLPCTAHEVQVILDGRLSLLVRPVKPPIVVHEDSGSIWLSRPRQFKDEYCRFYPVGCPYGEPGDILWAQETFWQRGETRRNMDGEPEWWRFPEYCYVATDAEPEDKKHWEKRPSIHMPREASRIGLSVKKIQIGKLQDMKPAGFQRAGILLGDGLMRDPVIAAKNLRYYFRDDWDSVNVKRGLGWDTNPWAFFIDVERIGGASNAN